MSIQESGKKPQGSDPATASGGPPSAPSTERLLAALRPALPDAQSIDGLRRLSGGASQETWSFDAVMPDHRRPLILRRSAVVERGPTAMALETEAELQNVVRESGAPVAEVVCVLESRHDLGSGYVMARIEGETLAPRILRQDDYASARAALAASCGEILAALHGIDIERLPPLRSFTGPEQIEQYGDLYRNLDEPRPIFDLALVLLADRLPDIEQPRLVHGDFRLGNLIVSPRGVEAVLDWELAHLGDPHEDLAWLCVNSWRFGRTEKPVAGCGDYGDLFGAYERATGEPVDRDAVRAWEIFGTLKWGVMCMMQGFSHLTGARRSVEKAAIGRRVSETEADLARLLSSERQP